MLTRSKKRALRVSLVLANVVLLVVVTAFVLNSSNSSSTPQASALASRSDSAPANALDQLSSADIAVQVAHVTELDEAVAVVNHADSVETQLTITPFNDTVVSKPQIVSGGLKSNKDITTYTTVAGDTVDALADKFKITSDTIRWSNNLSGNALPAGRELVISPENGIVYTVKAGDTIDSITNKFRANKQQLIAFNDAELTNSFKVGEKIVIPGGVLVPVATSNYSAPAFGTKAVFGYNGYDYGWCTWWVATRRAQIGKPLPANLGNACSWLSRARNMGIPTSSMPIAGAVIWTKGGCLGHVGFVERINDDGSIWVTDMNSRGQKSDTDSTPTGGWNRVSWRRVTPDQFGRFQFIH